MSRAESALDVGLAVEGEDRETRDRLLMAASRLFAEHGFAKVTVRDICRSARANVAAVNYHFAGKAGLYREVLRSAIQSMQGTTEAARAAGTNQRAENKLRAYVEVFVTRVAARQRDSWIHQLMLREMADPTFGLDMVVEEVITPRMAYLSSIVAELLACPADDPRVMRCAFSIHAQCIALMNHRIGERLSPVFANTPESWTAMIDHITEFSLAGLWALARRTE